MESFGAFLDEDWESLSKLFSSEDSDNFLPHTNHHDESLSFPCDTLDTNYFYCISQENSETCNALSTNQLCNEINNGFDQSLDFHVMDCENDNSSTVPVFADDMMEEFLKLKAELCNDQLRVPQIHQTETSDPMQLKRKYEVASVQSSEDKSSSENPKKKRSRVSKDKNKRNAQSRKKNKKAAQISNNGEENNDICNSEDDSNASLETNQGSASESKARTSRGSATDPQSLYARKRRERINERLKILQNLVPNGTKVDISTMLEEAVQYVKFLQVQIKLLSSDDLWMYAPIAYNGMDIGFYQKMMLPNLCHLGIDSV